MNDKHAVIWTRTESGPIKMGDLVVTEHETRFSYSEDFLESDNPSGLSLLASPVIYGNQPVVYTAKDQIPIFPRLMSLLPGHGPHNIQRRIYTRILEKRTQPPAPGLETDWEILLLAGHNGIGHLDIFRDDLVAMETYNQHSDTGMLPANRHNLWDALRNELQNETAEEDDQLLAQLIGPTPSVGGMIPKALVAIPDHDKWQGTFTQPGTRQVGEQPYKDVLLKIEPLEYRGVLALEAFCLDLHRQHGFEVPRHWLREIDGMMVLAIERFDRTPEGLPIPLESLFSLFAIGDKYFQETTDIDLAEAGNRITKLGEVCNLDVSSTLQTLYRRFILAFLTGNGDMHLENISLLGDPTRVQLSPVYDPAPMRAWSRHNTRSAIPIIFDDAIGGLRENLVAIGTSFSLSSNQAEAIIDEYYESTKNYPEQILNLDNVPEENRRFLHQIICKERDEIASTK